MWVELIAVFDHPVPPKIRIDHVGVQNTIFRQCRVVSCAVNKEHFPPQLFDHLFQRDWQKVKYVRFVIYTPVGCLSIELEFQDPSLLSAQHKNTHAHTTQQSTQERRCLLGCYHYCCRCCSPPVSVAHLYLHPPTGCINGPCQQCALSIPFFVNTAAVRVASGAFDEVQCHDINHDLDEHSPINSVKRMRC